MNECELLTYYCDEHAVKGHKKKKKKRTAAIIQALSIRITRINICFVSPANIHSLQ